MLKKIVTVLICLTFLVSTCGCIAAIPVTGNGMVSAHSNKEVIDINNPNDHYVYADTVPPNSDFIKQIGGKCMKGMEHVAQLDGTYYVFEHKVKMIQPSVSGVMSEKIAVLKEKCNLNRLHGPASVLHN